MNETASVSEMNFTNHDHQTDPSLTYACVVASYLQTLSFERVSKFSQTLQVYFLNNRLLRIILMKASIFTTNLIYG